MAFFNSNALKNHPLIRRYPETLFEWLMFLDAWDEQTLSAAAITAGIITADKITVTDLAAISADMGAITAGSIDLTEYIASGQTAYDTGTGFYLEYNGGTPRFSIGNSAGNKLTWDGSTLTVEGTVGGTVDAADLSGSIALGAIDVAAQGWQYDGAFSATDADTVAWASGTFTTADGTTYSITGSNTGNMVARTYIYLDIGTSTTAFQTSSTASDAVGTGKVLVAVAEDATDEAFFQVFGGIGGTLVTANEIAANAVTANAISVNDLAAINADMGAITAGSITLSEFIKSGQTAYDTGIGFYLEYNGGTPRMSIGNSSGDKLTWDGSSLGITGDLTFTNSSGSFSPTYTGFSSDPTGNWAYQDFGIFVILWVEASGYAQGTSNANSFTITNLPTAIRPSAITSVIVSAVDNSGLTWANANVGTSGTITFINQGMPNNWTTSGGKALAQGATMVYATP